MTYFITGATGVVGSEVARLLLATGASIRALRRAESDISILGDLASKIEWIEGDVLDIISLEEGMKGADYVIHAAAIVSFGSKKMESFMAKVNIEGTQNVVNVALTSPSVKKMCYISSIAAIGRSPKQEWVDEKGKWEEMDNHSFYGYTKYQGELEIWRGIAEGLTAVIVNPALILGTGNWEQSSLKLFKYGWEGKSLMPKGVLNYVDARDVAKAIYHLTESEETQNERFILCGGQIPYKDFFESLHKHFDKQVHTKHLQPWMESIASMVGSLQSLLGMKPVINKETIASSRSLTKFNGSKILQTGFEYHPLEDTLKWACTYFKERYS